MPSLSGLVVLVVYCAVVCIVAALIIAVLRWLETPEPFRKYLEILVIVIAAGIVILRLLNFAGIY